MKNIEKTLVKIHNDISVIKYIPGCLSELIDIRLGANNFLEPLFGIEIDLISYETCLSTTQKINTKTQAIRQKFLDWHNKWSETLSEIDYTLKKEDSLILIENNSPKISLNDS